MIDERSKPSTPPPAPTDDSVETLASAAPAAGSTRRRASRRLRVPNDPVPRQQQDLAAAASPQVASDTVPERPSPVDAILASAVSPTADAPVPASPLPVPRPRSVPPPRPGSVPPPARASVPPAPTSPSPPAPSASASEPPPPNDEIGVVVRRRKIRSVGLGDAPTPSREPPPPEIDETNEIAANPAPASVTVVGRVDLPDDDFVVPPADTESLATALAAPPVPSIAVPDDEDGVDLSLVEDETPEDLSAESEEQEEHLEEVVVEDPTEEITIPDDLHERPAERRSIPPPAPVSASSARDAGRPPPPPQQTKAQPAESKPESKPESKKKKAPWWKDLFNDDYFRTMPKHTPEQIAAEGDFIESSLGVEKGAAILDIACGAGRQAIELALRGYEVIALDLSLPMLSRAADDAQDRGAKLNFLHSDMREMEFDQMFDAAYCVNTSFGFFDDEKNIDVARRIHRALKSGGTLLLDVLNRDYVIQNQPAMVWYEGDGCVCMEETTFNYITSRLNVKRTMIFDDGRQREIEYSIRMYSLHELGKILHDVGFRIVEVSGHPRTAGAFFGHSSQRLIILAQKRPVEDVEAQTNAG